MAKDIEHYHREFLALLDAHQRTGGQGLPEQYGKPSGHLRAAGHQAIRALVEEIHDQGYVLGQLHADGIFPEGEEGEVAEREDRLGIPELKRKARARAAHPSRNPDTLLDPVENGLRLLGQVEADAERRRNRRPNELGATSQIMDAIAEQALPQIDRTYRRTGGLQ
jgi:hypothetical protein